MTKFILNLLRKFLMLTKLGIPALMFTILLFVGCFSSHRIEYDKTLSCGGKNSFLRDEFVCSKIVTVFDLRSSMSTITILCADEPKYKFNISCIERLELGSTNIQVIGVDK